MANGNATFGLCTAFLAGPSTSNTNSGRDASTAFKALIAANGGTASATKTFCQTYVAKNHPGQPATTGKPATTDKPATTRKPATAGKSSSHARVPTPNSGGTTTADTASGGASAAGTTRANAASGGASTAGSANSGTHRSH
jgi:hypothetical protein